MNLMTIEEIAALVADSEANIIDFIREERIPFVATSEGISIPLGGFQLCIGDLYDLNDHHGLLGDW